MQRNLSPWKNIKAGNIPTIELDPVIYRYISPGCRILDIGCANGKVSIPLALHGYFVTGIDINTDILRTARSSSEQKNSSHTPSFVKANASILPFPGATFDVAFMQALLGTVVSKDGRARVIREVCRVLKPQGHIYIADFGQTWRSKIYRERYINGLPVTKEEGSFLAYDEDTGEVAYTAHHFTEKELVLLLVENGFEVEYFRNDRFVTRTGNRVNGFVIVAQKV
ncbi:class I SAM-dependent methyltransferase [Methanolobus halotolerans]|uniref:SAM-dependent methyltransferase n=1 Tax=Methanolobus halotolerans TaxID=2052935 RepID=A0A4E0Q087_9EURY|nr:class I SAM-dependent methyltransferase [Methanolobus halotolerans]TGC09732.1 SAM-dependent methyltransferase [Methanolobus halotolerans]